MDYQAILDQYAQQLVPQQMTPEDIRRAQIRAAGVALMGARRGREGEALARAGMFAMGVPEQLREQQRAQQQAALQGLQGITQLRSAQEQYAAQKAARESEEAYRTHMASFGQDAPASPSAPATSMPPAGGSPPAGLSGPAGAPPGGPRAMALQQEVSRLYALAEHQRRGGFYAQADRTHAQALDLLGKLPKRAETRVAEVDGQRRLVNIMDDGTHAPIEGALPEPDRLTYQDRGGYISALDARGNEVKRLPKTATPAEVAAQARAGKEAGPKPHWDAATGQWIFPPSAEAPQGRALQPQGYVGKSDPKAAQSDKALAIIAEARPLVEQATGSYFGAALDQGARAFGKSTGGDIAIAQLRTLEANLMLNQPRMEGPQSNLDVALYKQAAGEIGDPTVPRPRKLAALDVIERMHRKYNEIGGRAAAPAQSEAAPKVIDFRDLSKGGQR